jgi:hypothetical protein
MAKYVQDIYINGPLPPFSFSKQAEEEFYAENKYLWKSLHLIEDLYNYNFPNKYATHDNLWRMFVRITADPNLDVTQPGFENWFYLDLEQLKTLDETGRKNLLFKKVANQIISICKHANYSFTEFENTIKIIEDKNIVFDEPHKKTKSSADRKHKAYIWRKYNEFENATYIKVTNKADEVVLFKKIADQKFSAFDRISWQDNETILIYELNSYNGGYKEADDYYKISLDGAIEYIPQTREGICYYGIHLLDNPETFAKGLDYIKIAEQMGHGKAKNILLNLKINPNQRDIKVLMQLPDKRQLDLLRRAGNSTIVPDPLL